MKTRPPGAVMDPWSQITRPSLYFAPPFARVRVPSGSITVAAHESPDLSKRVMEIALLLVAGELLFEAYWLLVTKRVDSSKKIAASWN